jgi:hypothetical protein
MEKTKTNLRSIYGEPSAAEVLALANRLRALKLSPGFQDLRLICERISNDAQVGAREFEGFDPLEVVKMQMQARTAHRVTNEIFAMIDAAIANAQLPGLSLEDPQAPEHAVPNQIAGSY